MDKDNKLTEVITELVPKAAPSTFDVQIQVCSLNSDNDNISVVCCGIIARTKIMVRCELLVTISSPKGSIFFYLIIIFFFTCTDIYLYFDYIYIFVYILILTDPPPQLLGLLHERPCGSGHRLHNLLVRVPVPASHPRPQGGMGLRLRPRAVPG